MKVVRMNESHVRKVKKFGKAEWIKRAMLRCTGMWRNVKVMYTDENEICICGGKWKLFMPMKVTQEKLRRFWVYQKSKTALYRDVYENESCKCGGKWKLFLPMTVAQEMFRKW